jgi:hypothetical protein
MSTASILFTFQNARGNFADLPTLADGQLFWAEDTKVLYIGTAADGNLQITGGGGVFPNSIANVAHKWLNSYDDTTGDFTQTQPASSDLSDASSLVTLTGSQTLTNKTLTAPTMTAPVLGTPASGNLANCTFPTLNQNTTGNAATATAALGLKTATTTVAISTATAPTAGQVLTATSGTAADWETPSGGGTLLSLVVDVSAADLNAAVSGSGFITLVAGVAGELAVPISLTIIPTYGSDNWGQGGGSPRLGYTNAAGSPLTLPSDWLPSGNTAIVGTAGTIALSGPSPSPVGDDLDFSINGSLIQVGPIATSSLGSSGGSGYAPGDTGFLDQGNGDATYVVDTVDGGGAVLTFHLDNAGTGYFVTPDDTTEVSTGGGDGGFLVNIDSVSGTPDTSFKLKLIYYIQTA